MTLKYAKNAFAAGDRPQTPLGSSQRSPRPHSRLGRGYLLPTPHSPCACGTSILATSVLASRRPPFFDKSNTVPLASRQGAPSARRAPKHAKTALQRRRCSPMTLDSANKGLRGYSQRLLGEGASNDSGVIKNVDFQDSRTLRLRHFGK